MSASKIKVSLDFGSSVIEVGTLVEQNQSLFFKFTHSFLERNIDISPIKLKKSDEIITCPKEPFDGLFGVFNDSIPDGWGRRLLDRKLIEKGINPREISALDRLSFVGKSAQGALIYEPYDNENKSFNSIFDLDKIAKEIITKVKENLSKWKSISVELGINKKESSLVEKAIEWKLRNA